MPEIEAGDYHINLVRLTKVWRAAWTILGSRLARVKSNRKSRELLRKRSTGFIRAGEQWFRPSVLSPDTDASSSRPFVTDAASLTGSALNYESLPVNRAEVAPSIIITAMVRLRFDEERRRQAPTRAQQFNVRKKTARMAEPGP